MKIKVKPCPFCGTEVKLLYKKPQAMITCPECKLFMARMDIETEADGRRRLAEAWNRRDEPNCGAKMEGVNDEN